MGIKVKCRKCNREADSELFKLHYKYKVMVCPDCFSGKTDELKQKEAQKKIEIIKPRGWDQDDEYLEKYYKQKEKQQTNFKRIPGTNHIECVCDYCKFKFKYDPFRKSPKHCPYCSKEVPRMSGFGML